MIMPTVKYWVGFNKIPGIGWVRLGRLLDYFGDLKIAWGASASDLKAAGLDNRTLNAFLDRRSQIDLDAEMERHQISVLTQDDPANRPCKYASDGYSLYEHSSNLIMHGCLPFLYLVGTFGCR